MWNSGSVTSIDLRNGAQTQVFTYNGGEPVLSIDWSFDQNQYAYAQMTADNHAMSFHLVTRGVDAGISTFTLPTGAGTSDVAVEFSPDGRYIALGAPANASGPQAQVQVRSLDGSLVFSSAGAGGMTWAGESTKLYFQGATNIETWDSVAGVSSLSEKSWLWPTRSSDGRWVAYVTSDYAQLRLIDTRSSADILVGQLGNTSVEWLTSTVLRFDALVNCSTSPALGTPVANCATDPSITCVYPDAGCSRSVTYNVLDGSQSKSELSRVDGTWPRGSPNQS
jgi:hypothetical protein